MRYPKFLENKSTIGFVAPSFGCVIEPYHSAFKNALKKFKSMGYEVDLGPNCFLSDGIGISTKPETCGKELNDYYLSDNNSMLISCGGGELMCEVLDFIDFESIAKAEPKWYLGYSDNTNFTYTSTVLCDTAAIYGPCAPTFGMEEWDASLFDVWSLVKGDKTEFTGYEKWEIESVKSEDNPYASYNKTQDKILKVFNGNNITDKEVSFSGRLLGGCLDTLVTLAGSEYDKTKEFSEKYKEDGIIFFLEACDLSVLQVRRAIWQLKHLGWFNRVKGFVFGRPYHFDEPELGLDRYEAVLSHLRDLKVPIVMDADLGHLPPALPFVSGAFAHIKAGKNITIRYDFR